MIREACCACRYGPKANHHSIRVGDFEAGNLMIEVRAGSMRARRRRLVENDTDVRIERGKHGFLVHNGPPWAVASEISLPAPKNVHHSQHPEPKYVRLRKSLHRLVRRGRQAFRRWIGLPATSPAQMTRQTSAAHCGEVDRLAMLRLRTWIGAAQRECVGNHRFIFATARQFLDARRNAGRGRCRADD